MTSSGRKDTVGTGLTFASLEKSLGYRFRDQKLLERALTHSSSVNDRQRSNERLEFLGDRVLGLIIADMLLREFPQEDEGALGYRFAALARREALARVAERFQLDAYIKREVDPSEMTARQRSGLLANACEAVIAAIYLDGSLADAETFVRENWIDLLKEEAKPPKDPKTQLQEYVQGKGWALPVYNVIEQKGPDHAPEFMVEVTVAKQAPARGQGSTKRSAETAAAETLFIQLTGKTEHG